MIMLERSGGALVHRSANSAACIRRHQPAQAARSPRQSRGRPAPDRSPQSAPAPPPPPEAHDHHRPNLACPHHPQHLPPHQEQRVSRYRNVNCRGSVAAPSSSKRSKSSASPSSGRCLVSWACGALLSQNPKTRTGAEGPRWPPPPPPPPRRRRIIKPLEPGRPVSLDKHRDVRLALSKRPPRRSTYPSRPRRRIW